MSLNRRERAIINSFHILTDGADSCTTHHAACACINRDIAEVVDRLIAETIECEEWKCKAAQQAMENINLRGRLEALESTKKEYVELQSKFDSESLSLGFELIDNMGLRNEVKALQSKLDAITAENGELQGDKNHLLGIAQMLQTKLDAIKKACEPFINYYTLALLWDEGEPFDTTVEIDICSPDPNDDTQYAILKGDFKRLKEALDKLTGGEE